MLILLIEDDDDFRAGLAANLRDDGHQVMEYVSARQLPPLDSFDGVQVLITDYDLPGENGLRLAERFHLTHPATRIVIVTAYATPYLEAQAAGRDYVVLLGKPLEYETIHHVIQGASA